jgi:hypothetical protein
VTASRIEDLAGVSVEHMLGLATGLPLVKFRAESEGTVLLGQLEPAQAREIAANLFEAAARAEYEADFARTATAGGLDGETLGQILLMIRNGEERRHA